MPKQERIRLKHVVSVSLGASSRDHAVEIDIFGERVRIERRGTDGSVEKAIKLIRELDGNVDAMGMGGIDLYIAAGKRRYTLRAALPLARAARRTPIVDGSGLKNTLERRVVRYLQHHGPMPLEGKTALMVASVDRFGMAEALAQAGCRLILGDLMFVLGLPLPIRSLRTIDVLARVIVPVVRWLPISVLYPTGKNQEEQHERFPRYFAESDIIAGDFHFIRRAMPSDLTGKMILTNTVTANDVELLRARGARLLVTTTPKLEGRSFGTNVMEAVLVAVSGKRPEQLTTQEYEHMIERMGFQPRIEQLNG